MQLKALCSVMPQNKAKGRSRLLAVDVDEKQNARNADILSGEAERTYFTSGRRR
jgi:hypothetical protein